MIKSRKLKWLVDNDFACGKFDLPLIRNFLVKSDRKACKAVKGARTFLLFPDQSRSFDMANLFFFPTISLIHAWYLVRYSVLDGLFTQRIVLLGVPTFCREKRVQSENHQPHPRWSKYIYMSIFF